MVVVNKFKWITLSSLSMALAFVASTAMADAEFLDDYEPAPSAPAAPEKPAGQLLPNAPAPAQAQPEKQTANFPNYQCSRGRFTGDARVAKRMFEQVIGFDGPFQKTLADGSRSNAFDLFGSNNELQVRVLIGSGSKKIADVPSGTYNLNGFVCQAANGLIVKLVHWSGKEIFVKVRPIDSNRVKIHSYSNGQEDADGEVFSGQARSTR